ncbi:MAG TPA: riboflavin synthase [Burkholderiales bacterium]|jgi:riboflavin synthase|nr:riboflavin synthase [Burkholderiales bacterium]
MFTGIVQALGTVARLRMSSAGAALRVEVGALDLSDIAIGDSVCVDGVCLTVTALEGKTLGFDVSPETLRVTAGFRERAVVNLEKALKLSDRLGGHLVTGHVDAVGEVIDVEGGEANRSVSVRFPPALGRFIAGKGSIAMNGVSLTVNRVTREVFTVNLIAHTLEMTNLKQLAPGSRVNLEVDPIARYVDRLLTSDRP